MTRGPKRGRYSFVSGRGKQGDPKAAHGRGTTVMGGAAADFRGEVGPIHEALRGKPPENLDDTDEFKLTPPYGTEPMPGGVVDFARRAPTESSLSPPKKLKTPLPPDAVTKELEQIDEVERTILDMLCGEVALPEENGERRMRAIAALPDGEKEIIRTGLTEAKKRARKAGEDDGRSPLQEFAAKAPPALIDVVLELYTKREKAAEAAREQTPGK